MTLEEFTCRSFAFTEFVAEKLLDNGYSLDFRTVSGLDYLTITAENPAAEKQYVVALRGNEVRGSLIRVLRFASENREQKIFLCVLQSEDKQFLERVLQPLTQNVEVHQCSMIDRYRFYKKEFDLGKRKI